MKKLLLTLVACFVAVAASAQYSSWYVNVIGTFNGWGTNGIQPGSGTTTTHKNLPIGTSEFRIKCWDGSADINYSTGSTVQVGVPTKLTKGNANSMTISGATNGETFNVEFNIATETMTITRPGEDQVIDWYVCGDFQGTNWDPGDANYKFTKQSDGSYKSPTISKLTNFLITQGDWASKYGGDGSDVTVGTPYSLKLNGQDLSIGNGKYVQNAVITIDKENKMTVTGRLIDEGAKYYLVGDAFGGWSTPNDYELTQTAAGSGTYSITASFAAGAGFKICSGSTYYTYNEAPIPAEGGTFTVYTGGTGNDTKFAATMTDATIDFNPAEMTLTVTPSGIVSAPILYIVGNNINGNEEWVVGDDNELTYDESSKTYTWEGSILGSGFKINNGAWDVYNIGAPSADGSNVVLILNQPFTIENNGGSKNIELGSYPSIVNPKVTLSLENSTLTITGQYGYPESMYILGNVDGSEFVPESAVEMSASSGVYTIEANVTESSDGYGYIQFATQKAPEGSDSPWDNMGIRLGSETANLEVVLDASSHNATYELYANGSGTTSFKVTPGVYNVEVNYTGAAPQVTFSQKPEPLYLMGYDEDGSVTLRQEMTPSSTDPKVYEYTYTVPNYSKGFKFYFSTTGKTEAKNNFVPTVANQSIRFGADNTYKATWSNVGTGNAIDYVAGETTFRFNIETLECELKYEDVLVNFEFTGVENAYYYVNMFNLTGDDNVVYLNGNSVQYGIDKSGLTGLIASPKDGYTLKITCPEASVPNQNYMIQSGGLNDEQQIYLYPGAQGYTFTFTVSEKVEAEPVYSFKGQSTTVDFEVDGNTLTYFGVLTPQTFVIEKKVNDQVVATYKSIEAEPDNHINRFGDFNGSDEGINVWDLSAVVVNPAPGSPIMLTFNLEDLVLTVSTGITADTGSDETEQSGEVNNSTNVINILSNNDAVLVFFNVPEGTTGVYYQLPNVQPLNKRGRYAAPDGYEEATVYKGAGDDKGRYAVSLETGTTGTLNVIYEIGDAQSKATTYTYTVVKSLPTDVDGIAADEEGAEYYSLDGVKVKNPEKGIYIRVKNGEVTKVVK